jgi:hypothetical protein
MRGLSGASSRRLDTYFLSFADSLVEEFPYLVVSSVRRTRRLHSRGARVGQGHGEKDDQRLSLQGVVAEKKWQLE